MPVDPKRVQELFLAAVEVPGAEVRGAARATGWQRPGTAASRAGAAAHADDEPASVLDVPFVEAPPPAMATATESTAFGPGTVRSSAPISCCSKSAKAAWASSTWPSRSQPVQRQVALKVIKPGMDSQAGHRPLRGRAAGAGADGSSQHRQGAGRRHDRDGPAVLRDGAGQGRADHRVLRRATPDARGSGWSCSCRSVRRCSTPIRRASSTATSSRPTSSSPSTTSKPVPKVIDFGVAKADGPAADRAGRCSPASGRSSARSST